MHTMSDQIGDNDDFDRDSRVQQYQTEQNKAYNKRRMNAFEQEESKEANNLKLSTQNHNHEIIEQELQKQKWFS